MPADQPQWIRDHCREVGDRIRSRRLWLNLTQEHLAEQAGISWTTLQRVEAGSTGTQISYYLLIAKALEIDPADFFKDLS